MIKRKNNYNKYAQVTTLEPGSLFHQNGINFSID